MGATPNLDEVTSLLVFNTNINPYHVTDFEYPIENQEEENIASIPSSLTEAPKSLIEDDFEYYKKKEYVFKPTM
jgi:hypothetical protein